MIRMFQGRDRHQYAREANEMFRLRARQFRDRLGADGAGLVEEAAGTGEAAPITFGRIHRLAATAAGRPDEAPAAIAIGRKARRAAPHLTEPWFCCAQPTRRQIDAF